MSGNLLACAVFFDGEEFVIEDDGDRVLTGEPTGDVAAIFIVEVDSSDDINSLNEGRCCKGPFSE